MSIFAVSGSPERSLEQHRTIREAIASRDSKAAHAAMHAHLVRVESDVHRALTVGPATATGGMDG
jgi:DNA-binding FadR family transcriptional regulator